MKRKVPVESLDQFFTIRKERNPVPIEKVIPISRPQLTVTASQPQRNTPHVTISSLSDVDESKIDAKCEEMAEFLKGEVEKIFNSGDVNFAQMFNRTEYVCRNKGGEFLYKKILPEIETATNKFASSFDPEMKTADISAAISQFEDHLSDFQKIFLFLDRTYVYELRIGGFTSLVEVAHDLLRHSLSDASCDTITAAVLQSITEYRLADSQEEAKNIKICVEFAKQCKFYDKPLESAFLLQTKDYFEEASSDLDLNKLMTWAPIAIEKEKSLSECGFLKSTADSINAMFNNICLENSGNRIFDSPDFSELIAQNDTKSLIDIARLYDGEKLRPIIISHFSRYWGESVNSIFDSPKRDWIPNLLLVAYSGISCASIVFKTERAAINATKDAMLSSIRNRDKRGEVETLLAKYISKEENEFDHKVLSLFKLLEAEECFEASYSYTLKKKIIEWKINPIRESKVITALEKEKGKDYTQQMHELIKDYNTSVSAQQAHTDGIDYKCLWMHMTNWTCDETKPVFPPAIQALNSQFAAKMKGKQDVTVFFSASLSRAVLKYKDTDISMSGEQAIIITELQNSPSTIKDLATKTNINETSIEANMAILQKENFVVKDGDEVFSINNNLELNPGEYSLPIMKKANIDTERLMSEEKVKNYRDNVLKSKIMLILKEFKTLKLQDLMQKLKKEITFTLDQNKFLDVLKVLTDRFFIQERSPGVYCFN